MRKTLWPTGSDTGQERPLVSSARQTSFERNNRFHQVRDARGQESETLTHSTLFFGRFCKNRFIAGSAELLTLSIPVHPGTVIVFSG